MQRITSPNLAHYAKRLDTPDLETVYDSVQKEELGIFVRRSGEVVKLCRTCNRDVRQRWDVP